MLSYLNYMGTKRKCEGHCKLKSWGNAHKTLLPEMPWVHSDAQDAFALFLQSSRDKMDDHIEEGSMEEEDEGSNSSFC